MSTGWSLTVSLILLILNAFFVAAEFALVASKRHRLEQAAAGGSRAARSALAGVRELSMMLAGAQLGITLCTLGLGALAKPTVAHLLEPAFEATGLPESAAYVVSFILAVAVVGFLHVVLGEMAPKSWAISHPETSALLLAVPFRAFTWLTRPALVALNGLANACLRLVKVEPQDELAQAHGPEELRMLIEASQEHGTLGRMEHDLLTAMLGLQNTTVRQVMTPAADIVTVAADAAARDVEQVSHRAGRSRIAVVDPVGEGRVVGIVHIRDAVRATTFDRAETAADLMAAPLRISADLPVARAVRAMREHRVQIAVAIGADDDDVVGIVALEDLLEEIIGEFDDETDPVPAAASARGGA
ncbi:hemolysin family protein [Virgisporangium ochraceum]|uniref:Membrane protein n=1 Tax=Virgisporangium ochraceum TaxID=65505 RepID=A0A8J3ZMF8_9ACTN|nr:hemolysin family protein [Virgisporangium ochraceum]GIJ65493.1 membrane protein [Virgisporangium ochraceum]